MLSGRKNAKEPTAVTILMNSKGQPWTGDGFRTSRERAYKKAGIEDLHFHEFQGTAVTQLALAGCTVLEIASITGHRLKTVREILDKHHFGGRLELVETAIKKLDALVRSHLHLAKSLKTMVADTVRCEQVSSSKCRENPHLISLATPKNRQKCLIFLVFCENFDAN